MQSDYVVPLWCYLKPTGVQPKKGSL